MNLKEFTKLHDTRIFKIKVNYRLKRKTDFGYGYSHFDEIDDRLQEFFKVERFEIAEIGGLFSDTKTTTELFVYIDIKNKDMENDIDILIMRSPKEKILWGKKNNEVQR